MKPTIFALFFIVLLWFSCNNKKSEQVLAPSKNTQNYTGPIIDIHIHAFQEGHPLFGMTHPPTLRGKTYEGVNTPIEQIEKTLAKFRKHNIVKAVVTNGQSWQDEAGELILIGGANNTVDALKNQYREGQLDVIAEMAPFYKGILADDTSQMPYFDLAQELDIPVGFHIFPGGPNYGVHLMPEMLGGMRTYNASPLQLEEVLVKYPHLRLYIMHGGWPFVDDVKALMYAHPQLYVDVAVVNWILPQEEFNAYLKALINAGFGDRIMYGSDQMVWPQVISVGIESVNNADCLTLEQKEDIFFDNASRFLGIDEEEIKKYKNPQKENK